MQTLEQLLDRHPGTLRARGLVYQRQRRVRIVRQSESRIHATVRGTRLYSVVLERGPRVWEDACTCPAHRDRGECKHVCAVLAELLSSGAAAPPGMRLIPAEGAARALASEDDDDAEDDEFADMDANIERLLADRSVPRDLKRQVLARLLNLRSLEDLVERMESESQRARRLLQSLELAPPMVAATRRGICLRYVVSPLSPNSDAVGFEIQGAKISARGEVGAYRVIDGPPHERELDETDRMAVAVLIDAPIQHGNSYSYVQRRAQFALQPTLQRLLLPNLSRQQRLFLSAAGREELTPVALDEGQSWNFQLDVDSSDKGIEFEGALERMGERIPLSEVACVLAGGFAIARGELRSVDWHGAHGWAAHLRGASKLRVAIQQRSDITRVLASAPVDLPVRATGLVEDLAGPPRPVLVLLAPEGTTPQLQARLEFEYGGARLRRGGASVIVQHERVLRARRDGDAEARAEAQFLEAGGKLRAHSREPFDGTLERKRLGTLVRALALQGWLVEGEGLKLRTEGEFAISVSSGIDWFDVEAKIEFEGVGLELPALLEALQSRQSLVRLGDGSFGVVPETWLARWQSLGALGEMHQGALRVKRSRGFLLDTLLAERSDVQTDAGFEAMRTRLARAKSPEPTREPAAFAGQLRPYQRAGLGWLAFLGEVGMGGCLADDMGLGKTVQVLALILRRKPKARGPTLVVAPKTLLFNWEREAQRFAPNLNVHVHHGPARDRRGAALEDADLVVTTYATLRLDVEFLGKLRFDLLVLDEAQAIKNASSQSAKAARILQADQRLALTGTPIENRVEDLLSIFEFLNPGLLEGSRVLRQLLEADDELQTARLAARALGPFILRRTKEEVLTELPRKSEQIVHCELEGAQRREYDALREYYRRTLLAEVDQVGIAKVGINVLAALLRLRQAACHLALIDEKHAKTHSAKLDTLYLMLEELRDSGHKALVFSQFTSFLALVKPELEKRKLKYDYLDGQTRDREQRVENFQKDASTSVFLISLKAGGVGLNLTAADYVFLLDPWWNPAVERQAIDRTHRIGQTRPVTAYRLVARDTVEEKVLALQERKRALADALFEGAGSALRELTREDLEAILS